MSRSATEALDGSPGAATAHVGDQVLIVARGASAPHDGRVLEVREGATGPVYLVEWTDDLVRSVLIIGSQVRIRHLFGCGGCGEPGHGGTPD
jgi:hypothetical protein